MTNKSQKIFPIIFLMAGPLAAIWFAMAILLFGALTPGYSHVAQYVSELGAVGAPYAFYMNWLAIVPFGILICIFSMGIFLCGKPHFLKWVFVGTLFLVGVGFLLAGGYSCDEGCRFVDMTISGIVHNIAAMGAFLGAIVAALLASLYFHRVETMRKPVFLIGLFCAAMLLAFIGLVLAGPLSPIVGALQRLFLAGFCLWLSLLGWNLFQEQVGRTI